ncbi:MAG: hypothetical protein ACRCZ9_12230 [Fusobacteriaceae bacterium]
MILNESIVEFDIAQCNINVMLDKGLISIERYNYLKDIDKKKRVVEIGLLMRDDKNIRENLKIYISEYVKNFISSNNISDMHILEVANDALWVVGFYPHKLRFGEHVKFVPKRKATIMMRIGKIGFYYNSITDDIFTRGIGQDVNEEQITFIKTIKNILKLLESNEDKKLYDYIHSCIKSYKSNILNTTDRIDIVTKRMDDNVNPKDDSNFKLLIRILNEIYVH